MGSWVGVQRAKVQRGAHTSQHGKPGPSETEGRVSDRIERNDWSPHYMRIRKVTADIWGGDAGQGC